jgi:hypothetical protein
MGGKESRFGEQVGVLSCASPTNQKTRLTPKTIVLGALDKNTGSGGEGNHQGRFPSFRIFALGKCGGNVQGRSVGVTFNKTILVIQIPISVGTNGGSKRGEERGVSNHKEHQG